MADFLVSGDGPGYQRRFVQFRPQGAGQPAVDKGNNVKLTRAAAVYSAVFTDKPQGYAGMQVSIGNSLAHDVRPVGTPSPYNEQTGTLTFTIFADKTTGAVASDIAANVANVVSMWVEFVGKAKI